MCLKFTPITVPYYLVMVSKCVELQYSVDSFIFLQYKLSTDIAVEHSKYNKIIRMNSVKASMKIIWIIVFFHCLSFTVLENNLVQSTSLTILVKNLKSSTYAKDGMKIKNTEETISDIITVSERPGSIQRSNTTHLRSLFFLQVLRKGVNPSVSVICMLSFNLNKT